MVNCHAFIARVRSWIMKIDNSLQCVQLLAVNLHLYHDAVVFNAHHVMLCYVVLHYLEGYIRVFGRFKKSGFLLCNILSIWFDFYTQVIFRSNWVESIHTRFQSTGSNLVRCRLTVKFEPISIFHIYFWRGSC